MTLPPDWTPPEFEDLDPLVVFVTERFAEEEASYHRAHALIEQVQGQADPRYDQSLAQIVHLYSAIALFSSRYQIEADGPFRDGLKYALMAVASPFESHPNFRPEWHIDLLDVQDDLS